MDDEEFPENTALFISAYNDTYYTRIPDEYGIIESHPVSIYSFDFDSAAEMEFFESEVTLDTNEVSMNQEMADTFGFEVGQTIIIHDINKEEVTVLYNQGYCR